MATNTAPKRSRANADQLNRMLDFFMDNPGLAEGNFQRLHGKYERDKKWSELAAILNNFGGTVKTVHQWNTVWRDLKSRTITKVRERKYECKNELERRVIALIGSDYIEEQESDPENFSMEEELQLEYGEENELLEMPRTSRNFTEASEVNPKRSRATTEQLNRMLDFFMNTPGMAEGKIQKLHGKHEHDKKWSELAAMLNSVGGTMKSVEQWHTVWRDLKSRTSIKVRERKRQQAQTGNRSSNHESKNELERRVIALIGSDYVDEYESDPLNVPMKEEPQLKYMDEMPSTSPNIAEDSDIRCDTPCTPDEKRSRRAIKRKNTDDKLHTTFLKIADKQADALKMIAQSNAANAEANKLLAEGFKALGEGLRSCAESINNLANSMKLPK